MRSEYYQNKISRLKTAMSLLKKAVNLDNKNYETLTSLGRVYLHLWDTSKAEMYLVKSLAVKKDQPYAISWFAIWLVVQGNYKDAYKVINKAIKEWDKPNDKILMLTVKAKIVHWYEKEKKSFNAHYEKFKMEASIGNKVTIDDLDEDLSSDEEEYNSDDEVDTAANQNLQIGRSLTYKKIKTKIKNDNRSSIISQDDISIAIDSESGSSSKAIEIIDEAIDIANSNIQRDSINEISGFLDLHTLNEIKTEIMLEMKMIPQQQEIERILVHKFIF